MSVVFCKQQRPINGGAINVEMCINLCEYLLVKGKLTVILEKNPSGGYLTNGSDKDGVMTRVVPGGRARRPSDVTHNIRF